MDTLWDENRPETCLTVGLDCRTCVQRSAAVVASLCPGLDADAAQQMFPQVFPSVGCSPMAAAFALAYAESDTNVRRTPGLAIVAAA